MNHMQRCLAVLSFALVAASTHAYAAPILNLNVNGVSTVLVPTLSAGLQTYTYNNTYTNLLDTRTTTFLATYGNVAGIDTLNVTDVCAQLNVLGGTPQPCQELSFSFTDVSHSNASIISVLGIAGASVQGDVANINFGATVGSGSAQINFSGPAATPEPSSLALLATGLCGVAGVVRRRVLV